MGPELHRLDRRRRRLHHRRRPAGHGQDPHPKRQLRAQGVWRDRGEGPHQKRRPDRLLQGPDAQGQRFIPFSRWS
jgi:hypothetical protein